MAYTKDDFTLHMMPVGSSCWYRDGDHSYWESIKPKLKTKPDGEWCGKGKLTGVSTVTEPFDWESGALMRWAVKMNLKAVVALVGDEADEWDQGLDWLFDWEKLDRKIKDKGISDEDIKEAAGERGTNVHYHVLNALALGATMPDLSQLSEEERGYANGVIQFWLDHDPVAQQAEQVVYDQGLRIAGRLDFRGTLNSVCADRTCPCHQLVEQTGVLDLKTGNYIGPSAHAQVAGYDHLARSSGFGKSRWHLILKVREDGSYDLIRGHAKMEDFLGAIEIYRRAKVIRNAAKADWKAREEAA